MYNVQEYSLLYNNAVFAQLYLLILVELVTITV
jgi:hypothetical protein